jgi:inosose dehydratase
MMRVASAPVSWGITEVAGLRADLPYARVLDEIGAAGYAGTELGPWGFYPTDPAALGADLAARGMAFVGAFIDVPIHDRARFDEGRQAVRQVLPLMAALDAPALMLSAQQTPERARVAGRATADDALPEDQWRDAADYLRELAQLAADAGRTVTFHHHAGTYIESPAEIARLFDSVDPALLGLCLDTGHLAYGGGDPLEALERYGPIIRHVHLKNVDARVLARVRAERRGYVDAIRAGVFCPLDRGAIPIGSVLAGLRERGYDGWLVVEQDIDLSQPDHPDPLTGATRARAYLREVAAV